MEAAEARSAERAAQNELTFRRANEGIEAARQRLGLEGPTPYLCECELEACTELAQLDQDAYRVARAGKRRFVIARGHPARMARVVDDRGSYIVVEKDGRAGELAEGSV